MVEYSEILAYMKKMFPQKGNSELTRMSYAIWKKGNIKNVSDIRLKNKHQKSSKKKNNIPVENTNNEPSALVVSQQNLQHRKNKAEILKEKAEAITKSLGKKDQATPIKHKKTFSNKTHKSKNRTKIDHSYDDIVAESRGFYIHGTFSCKRCGKIRHNGYKYKGYINICMLCRRDICGRTGGSVWAISTPMK